ncbi:MAG: DUF3109 domain-containing protein, partial [Bacteroidetes bacterium]
ITEYADFDAVNYHKWPICSSALSCGVQQGTPIYQSLEEPLVRKYGRKWYDKLVAEVKKQKDE